MLGNRANKLLKELLLCFSSESWRYKKRSQLVTTSSLPTAQVKTVWESDLDILYSRIHAQVRRYMSIFMDLVSSELLEDELQELTQIAWFRYLEKTHVMQVDYPYAYLARIAR